MAVYLLAMPFAQALAGVMIPVALVAMLTLKAPDLFVLATFAPLVPTLAAIAVEVTGLREFGRVFGERIGALDYVRLVVGTVPYQLVLAAAAARATALGCHVGSPFDSACMRLSLRPVVGSSGLLVIVGAGWYIGPKPQYDCSTLNRSANDCGGVRATARVAVAASIAAETT
jgi:hypothetical protein